MTSQRVYGDQPMPVLRLKGFVLVGLLAGYLTLDYGFMLARIPPGSDFGVPLGELFLLVVLATTNLPLLAVRFSSIVFIAPFILWWAMGFSRLLADSLDRGSWAFRDATQLIESLYVLAGFAVAGEMRNIKTIVRALPVIVTIAALYGLFFPFWQEIRNLSPVLYGASGQAIPVFGTYALTGSILIFAGFYLMITRRHGIAATLLPMAGCFLFAFAVLIVQARTSYFQLIGVSVLLLAFRPKALKSFALTVPLTLLLVGIVSAFELRVSGRLTDISLDFLIDHIKAITGAGADRGGTGDSAAVGAAAAAAGVSLRYGWWERIYHHLTEDGVTLLSGLGYGVALTDFHNERGVLVREPHDSFISIVARLGVIGFVAWFWLQVELFRSWLRVYRQCRRLAWWPAEEFLLLVLAFALLVLIDAIGEDAFEKPYEAIPYYALWGFVLRLGYILRSAARPAPVASFTPAYPRQVGGRPVGASVVDLSD